MKSFNQLLKEASITGETPDKMALPYSNTLAQHVNVKEIPKGSNYSPEINRYLKNTGLDNEKKYRETGKGYAWCMAFVYTMFDDFVKKLGLSNPLPKTAGVLKHWRKADPNLKIPVSEARKDPSLVKPGQIFFLETNKAKGLGHTGIVTAVNVANKTYDTIEGNTNDKLSREGERVGRNTRKMSSSALLGFVDYFKGNRNRNFEETVAKVVAEAPTDYSPSESKGGLSIEQIKDVQRFLKSKGYDLGTYGPNADGVDGDYGSKTKAALKDWKSKNGMTADAVLDADVYKQITGAQSESPEVTLKDKRQTELDSSMELTTKVPMLFPNKVIKLDQFNLSKDPSLEIKKAVIENSNSFVSLGDMVNEESVANRAGKLIGKLRDIKKKSDTALADKYRGGIVSDSPIENPNVLDDTPGTRDILEVNPEVFFIHDKDTDKFYIKAANSQAVDLIGSKEEVEVTKEQLGELSKSFKEVDKSVSSDAQTVQDKSDAQVTSTVTTDKSFYENILKGIGAPITDENMKFLYAWRQAEGAKATNNPFNTTKSMKNDPNSTVYNSAKVRNYSTPEIGIEATVKTLLLPYYTDIVNDLKNDAGANKIANNIKPLKTWGTGGLIAKVLNGRSISPPPIARA